MLLLQIGIRGFMAEDTIQYGRSRVLGFTRLYRVSNTATRLYHTPAWPPLGCSAVFSAKQPALQAWCFLAKIGLASPASTSAILIKH